MEVPHQRDEIITINSLSDEVLCMIFDYLDMKSVKHASLCCRRWNNIIFFQPYVGRFVFYIDLTGCSGGVHNLLAVEPARKVSPVIRRKMFTEEIIRVLTQTDREYRNFKCFIRHSMNGYFSSIWQTLHQKFANNLHSLEIYSENRLLSRMFRELAETIPSIPNLDSLTIVDFYDHPFSMLMPIAKNSQTQLSLRNVKSRTLRSNSVRHLRIESTFKFKPDMPKLRDFDGALSALYNPPNPLALANITRLAISVHDMVDQTEATLTAVESIFRSLTLLEVLIWEIEVSNPLFLKICSTCTSLKELHFVSELNIHRMDILEELFKLKNLRSLSFELSCTIYDEAFNFDLSPLTKLEKLSLGELAIDFVGLPKSTTQLGVTIGRAPYEHVLSKISRNTQLTMLTCRCIGIQSGDFEATGFMETLPLLKSLEILEFDGGSFHASSFVKLGAPMMNLRTIRFINCTVDETIYDGLSEKFPNLRRIILLE